MLVDLAHLQTLLSVGEKDYDRDAAIKLLQGKFKATNLEGYKPEQVLDLLYDISFSPPKLQAHIVKLSGGDRHDVFDELAKMPSLDKLKELHILMPFHNGGNHWLTCEIKISKTGENKFKAEIYSHDPFGGGQLSEANYLVGHELFI